MNRLQFVLSFLSLKNLATNPDLYHKAQRIKTKIIKKQDLKIYNSK